MTTQSLCQHKGCFSRDVRLYDAGAPDVNGSRMTWRCATHAREDGLISLPNADLESRVIFLEEQMKALHERLKDDGK